jgi:hypothetical protein
MSLSKTTFGVIGLFYLCLLSSAYAHKKHAHHEESEKPKHNQEVQLKRINAMYLERVKPIFQKKCFDCHSGETSYPLYANLPIAKSIIDNDIREAKKHLDFSNDFPFQGHGTPKEDLEEILESVTDGDMPPLKYRVLHWGSKVTQDEIQVIRDWVNEGKKILETPLSQTKKVDRIQASRGKEETCPY